MPKLQSVPAAAVKAKLEAFGRVLQQSKSGDGSVDLVKARELIGGNPVMTRMLELARNSYASVHRPAVKISARDTEILFSQLDLAKKTVGTFDLNDDGKIRWNEEPANWESGLHRSLVSTLLEPSRLEKGKGWHHSTELEFSKEARVGADKKITELARHHAKTPAGQEALRWHMLRHLSMSEGFSERTYEEVFRSHESDWKAQMPDFLGGGIRKKKGHLSDGEVKRLVGSNDLRAFVEAAKKEVNVRLLMDYQTEYLAGKGVATKDAVNDPIFGVQAWKYEPTKGGGDS